MNEARFPRLTPMTTTQVRVLNLSAEDSRTSTARRSSRRIRRCAASRCYTSAARTLT
jgi:hypothetical protein